MATIKSLKPRLFSTTLDTIRLVPDISTDIDISENTIDQQAIRLDEVEARILTAKGVILLHLNPLYTETALRTTPWAGVLLASYSNGGSGKLWAATAGTDAYTELWKITFTSSTAFSAEGSISGSQGTGSTGATFTTTNSDLVIESGMWSGTVNTSDKFYINIYDTFPELIEISAKLSAAYCLQSIYTGTVPNEQDLSIKYERQALNYLKRLSNPDADNGMAIGGRLASLDLEKEVVDYEIDSKGNDISKYKPLYPDADGR